MNEEETWDGRLSIEHQIAIHLNDLLQFGSEGGEVREILLGLQYVMDYRVRSRKQPCVLDAAICERLVRTLLLFTGERSEKRRILGKELEPSANAEYSLALLADYCQQMEAVSGCSVIS